VLLPTDRPQTIVLGTNFGLVISDDGGGHWRWTCEHGDNSGGYRYTFTGDQRRLVGLSGLALVVTEDLGCTWSRLGAQDEIFPFDFFPDADPAFALVLVEDLQTRIDAVARLDLRQPGAIPQVLYRGPTDEQLTTVEVARTEPPIIYATLNPVSSSGRTRLVRSGDGGQTWAVQPIEAPMDAVDLRIAAVDPRDPLRLYFRAGTPLGQGESLLVSDDGGKTTRSLFTTTGALAAFFPLMDGALLSALELGVGHLYRWDGAAFTEIPAHISARGFAERAGLIYAATDNVADGFAVARSRDRGLTWERVMAFGDISAISRCGDLPAVCTASCSMLSMRGALQPALCTAPAASPDAAIEAAASDGPAATSGGGCSCRLGSSTKGRAPRCHPDAGPGFVLVLVLILAPGRRRRR
jgi:hypothetical protein